MGYHGVVGVLRSGNGLGIDRVAGGYGRLVHAGGDRTALCPPEPRPKRETLLLIEQNMHRLVTSVATGFDAAPNQLYDFNDEAIQYGVGLCASVVEKKLPKAGPDM